MVTGSVVDERLSIGWRIPYAYVGGFGHAPAHGDFLSALYNSGGCGISAPHGDAAGSTHVPLRRLRKTGADHVVGL